jgi:hypothetical protein
MNPVDGLNNADQGRLPHALESDPSPGYMVAWSIISLVCSSIQVYLNGPLLFFSVFLCLI